MGFDGEGVVEQENALLRPFLEIAVGWDWCAEVVVDFLEDILQTRGDCDGFIDGKGEAVGLVVAMIGVLTDDDNLYGVKIGGEGGEDLSFGRENLFFDIFLVQKVAEGVKIILPKLIL